MRLADVFGHGMVLQRDKKICIFGTGDGEGCVELCGCTAEFVSDGGAFKAYLPPMPAGGPHEMKVTLNGRTEVLTDVLIGDVYIAGGQSNMQFEVWESLDILPAENELVRYFKEGHDADKYKDGEEYYQKTEWQKASAETSAHFSAIGFEFANELSRRTGVPIGIIGCCQGASRIDAWTAPEIVEREEYQALMPEKHFDYNEYKFNQDCWLYRNKLLSIAPLSICGVLYYQGESNAGMLEAANYGKLFKYMAENWRELFCDPALPFYTVQIMAFHVPDSFLNWSDLRAQQEWASKNVPYTYMVTMANTGEGKLIHPCRKKGLAHALVNAVMSKQYGEDTEYSGPIAEDFEQIEDGLRVTFSHAEGLHYVGDYLDGTFVYNELGHPQTVIPTIEDNVVTLKWKERMKAEYVTMGYENYPHHNLYNSAGYLASPFKYVLKH